MASKGKRHCGNCIGTLSFPIGISFSGPCWRQICIQSLKSWNQLPASLRQPNLTALISPILTATKRRLGQSESLGIPGVTER